MAQEWCYEAASDAMADGNYQKETLATLIQIESYLEKICEHFGIKE